MMEWDWATKKEYHGTYVYSGNRTIALLVPRETWVIRMYTSKSNSDIAIIPTNVPGTEPCPIELIKSLITLRWEG